MINASPPESETTTVPEMVQVIHANWADEKLHLWVEQCPGRQWWSKTSDSDTDDDTLVHPNVVIPDWIQGKPSSIVLRLPMHNDSPMPSTPMSMYGGIETEEITSSGLADVRIPTLAIDAAHVPLLLESLIDRQDALEDFHVGPGVQYFVAASRLAEHLIAGHRFVPMVFQDATGMLTGRWQPWLADDMTTKRVAKLVSSMPAAARAVPDGHAHDAWSISVDFLSHITDASCRRVMMTEEMTDTIDSIDPGMDQQVAWLNGLLGSGIEVPATTGQRAEIARTVRKWIAELEDRGESSTWRFGLRLTEPITEGLALNIDQPDETVMWSMSFFLQSLDDEEVIIRGADVWLINRERIVYEGLTLENPQELLMGELGRASRYYKKLEEALDETEPIQLLIDTQEAYRFLREVKPVLEEQGIAVQCPGWWESQSGRLGTKLRIDSDPSEMVLGEGADAEAAGAQLGLGTLVGYHWEIAIGDTTLTLHEFEELAQKNSPLVRIGGQWVEIRPEDVENAISFMHENPGGEMELGEAMQLALASDSSQTGLPVTGVEATGWVASMLGGEEGVSVELPILETPDTFKGTLRPYQTRGLSWLAFMERFGFGACLADDMGLGKTIQMIALILHERAVNTERPDPTILVVPMSVIGNWVKEFEKFAPSLKIQVHHGVDRPQGDTFIEATDTADVVVTTYALVHRDNEFITKVKWGRVVLDEAQFVKNPAAKQSISVRSLNVPRRVAMTGTPVDNRLSELWSIMDFLNPKYLGSAGAFRKKFALPIERHRDQIKMEKLRTMVRPFILRRVKTDPTVVSDLPEKFESKEWCPLTSEQASLYEACVKQMLTNVEHAEGIHRRGLVLATLIKLKQICNHPAQMLKEADPQFGKIIDPGRSGKCVRLLEQLDELISEGDQALIFTQFRQMGHILSNMLKHELGKEVLFLHGGTSQGQRQKMIDTFQEATGKNPILLLSLKAGGVGLNLTAATHVFHFDRWWNPAVENQATDRAYRIGQTRTVQVHKYIVRGTLEERIDEMIESKTELAENIIGHGERWLTDLGTDKLRNLLALRADTISDE
ncbi:MAG: DEAD/DEAH box helicase [Phycisphaerales bacterium]|nr:DEAD/DEAH box helicase [Phycisphaerales bacterium]